MEKHRSLPAQQLKYFTQKLQTELGAVRNNNDKLQAEEKTMVDEVDKVKGSRSWNMGSKNISTTLLFIVFSPRCFRI